MTRYRNAPSTSLEEALAEALAAYFPCPDGEWTGFSLAQVAAHPAMQPFATAHERAERLAAALWDVVDTSPGDWEHFDGHCTRETECCAGHVARALAEVSPPTDSGRTP